MFVPVQKNIHKSKLRSLKKIRARNRSKSITWFRCILLFLGLNMSEFSINWNRWIYESKWILWALTPAKAGIHQSIHSLFNLAGFLTHVRLGFLWSSLRHFWSGFLFNFLRWNSTLCQIYWIPDLKSLKLVCFMVAKTWKRKCADYADIFGRRRVKTLQKLVEFF